MRTIVYAVVIVLFLSDFLIAQKRVVERTFETGDDEIMLDLKFGDLISVKAWDQDKVSFKAVIEINRGELNEALEVDFEYQNDRLKIESDYNENLLKTGRREDCPDRFSRFSWSSEGENYYVVCSKITYEIMVPGDADISIETISGDIELTGLSGPIRAKSISGFVDLSWPSGETADIQIKTISGGAYTDLADIHFKNKKDHVPLVGYELKGEIGNGGPLVVLESISGDIYLRSEK